MDIKHEYSTFRAKEMREVQCTQCIELYHIKIPFKLVGFLDTL